MKKLISDTISENLPSYTALKSDYISSRQAHRSHHLWTKQMMDAVEPLLKSESAPMSEQQNLSDLTLQCVEQTMQKQYQVDQLARRVKFLEEAVSQRLEQVGKEIGFPETLIQKLARLTRTVLDQHLPA